MITEKLTPLQIRRMERARRNGRKEKKRISEVSKHRSCYRWSNDWRHELRAHNVECKKDRFWERIETNCCGEENGMLLPNAFEYTETEILRMREDARAKARLAENAEILACFEASFFSEEFLTKSSIMDD